jgi:RNA polymerase sigma-70 factor, ECF subfamily
VHSTDDYLIQQFQAGDRDAFTYLVHRYKRNIFQFIFSKVKDCELASDLTQDVFIKMYQSAHLYQPTGKLQSWLFRMAQNICIDHYRKQSKTQILSLHSNSLNEADSKLIDQLADKADNPVNEVEYHELQAIIEQALDLLSEPQRTALVLCQYHGMSSAEIATIQNIPVGTVKSRIHNALTKVKEFLKEQGAL